ncbi:hypothetical protein [Novosphingobium sp. PASSN1]|uniref:hypothetical protein n=1 Tax=Novosphingobium sp. PASSN1 TaxID=2015561 RepID=UPI0025EB23E1|nr:hypothetical protein [Novosphingobium sp. PASSN1]
MGWRIIAALRRWKSALVERLPVPMAAPETPHLRSLRMVLVVELMLLGLLTAAWEPIASTSLGRIAPFAWLVLALNALIVGTRWLVVKIRADNAWAVRVPGE